MSEPICDFFVADTPRSGGSKVGFVNPKTGRVIVQESSVSKNKEWRAVVCHFAYHAYHGELLDGPLRVTFEFHRVRAKSHYGSGRNAGALKPSAPIRPDRRPDTVKTTRSTEDALTGIIWTDDARIVEHILRKRWGPIEGCRIIVEHAVALPEGSNVSHLPPVPEAPLFTKQEAIPC